MKDCAPNAPQPDSLAPTVFVVDDEEAMRNALRRVLNQRGLIVQTYASGPAFLAGYRPTHMSCLLLDVMMPKMNGLELQAKLSERGVDIPVIFLTGAADVPVAVAAMKAGAQDFLEKPFDNEVLVARVKQGIAAYYGRHQYAQQEDGDDCFERRRTLLTAREAEVMQLMLTGKSSKVIARTLGVSHRTIDIHRGRVMHKMQTETLAELVRMELSGRTGSG
jgi:two-component system response regulator FixJ